MDPRRFIWFPTRADAHDHLFEFIEVFYNRQRHQASLGHVTPTEYADKWRHDHGEPNLALTPCPGLRVTFSQRASGVGGGPAAP
jgi:hypothetical protein